MGEIMLEFKHDRIGGSDFWILFFCGNVRKNLFGTFEGIGLEQLFVPLDFTPLVQHIAPLDLLHIVPLPEE
jgi:hypothetical protein